MSEEIDYKEGDHSEFIQYLFSDSPKPQGTITLELPLSEPNKNIGLHVFEQLLMIFVDGLKYFYGINNKVDINPKTPNANPIAPAVPSLSLFLSINDYGPP